MVRMSMRSRGHRCLKMLVLSQGSDWRKRTDQGNSKPAHSGIGFPLPIKLADDTRHDEMRNGHSSTTEDGKLAAAHLVEVEEGWNASGLRF